MPEEQRFVLGIAYQAGPDPRIKRGVDGGRDFFSKSELERACWSYMRSGCPQINAFHVDGTEDCAEPVESFIWRWDDWDVGDGVVVKDGDWCLGAILSPRMWDLHKAGQVNAFSPEGTAVRRRVQKEGAVAVAKGSVDIETDDVEGDDGEFTEVIRANIPKVALVGQGANGIPRFLMSKQEGAAGLFDPDSVRSLLEKTEPATEASRAGETVTMSGSPAAIAALIHGAAVRKAAEPPSGQLAVDPRGSAAMSDADITRFAEMLGNGLAKAEESAKAQNDLPDSAFAYIEPGGTKDEDGKTVPRELRHFNIHDKAHADNAAARIAQGAKFGDKAKAKVEAAQRKFGEDVSKAEQAADATEVTKDMDMPDEAAGAILADPDPEVPGDPNSPGSPAWESVDSDTACMWTGLAARLRAAIEILADREDLEAATVDPDDAENAMNLRDAACAVDYVISVLAPFVIDEQSESDMGAMEMVGKAMSSISQSDLATVESLGSIRKAGRTLSASNESALRAAIQALQQILASLPAAPVTKEAGEPVLAKTANEEPDMPTPTLSEDVTAASGQEPAMGAAEAAPKPVAGLPVTEMTKAADEPAPVAKAEKVPQVAIYDAQGNLVGTVDPAEITMLAPAKAPEAAAKADDAAPEEPAAPAAEAPAATPTDLTPAPPASVGTPADAVPAEDDTVAKATETTENNEAQEVLKGSIQELVKAAIAEQSAPQGELIKSLEDRNRALEERNETLAKQAATLEERLTKVENQPAVMAIASNGVTPPPHLMRGQDNGARVDVAKGEQLRAAFKSSDDARQQKALAEDMNLMAIDKLREIHSAGPR